MFTYRRDLAVRLAEDVVARLGDGTYTAVPATTYDIGRLSEALGVVARAAQKGRVVVTLDGNPPVRPAVPRFSVRADATYLVTGGFGAVGLVMADWLVSQGARHLILIGQEWRHDAGGPAAGSNAWREAGVDVRDEAVDVSDAARSPTDRAAPPTCLRCVPYSTSRGGRRTGLRRRHAESIRPSLAPKVDGAWNLHDAVEAGGSNWTPSCCSRRSRRSWAPHCRPSMPQPMPDWTRWLSYALPGKPALSVNWGALQGGGGMAEASAGSAATWR